MAKTVQYLLNMDYSKVNPRSQNMLNVFLNNPKLKKYILDKKDTTATVTMAIFEYLQFDIEYERSIRKNIEMSLIKYDKTTGEKEPILEEIKVGEEKYDILLQEVRF